MSQEKDFEGHDCWHCKAHKCLVHLQFSKVSEAVEQAKNGLIILQGLFSDKITTDIAFSDKPVVQVLVVPVDVPILKIL